MHSDAMALAPNLAQRVLHFARALRAAGLRVGTDRIGLALQALQVAGGASREELHTVLAACLLDRREHHLVFDRAFDLFWGAEALADGLTPRDRESASAVAQPTSEPAMSPSMQGGVERPLARAAGRPAQAGPLASARERLLHSDFARMDPQQWRDAQRLMRREPWPVAMAPTRRRRRSAGAGRVDLRASLQAAARSGGECLRLRRSQPERRPAPLLLLADVSRSMSAYAQALLQLAHGLARPVPGTRRRVESFVFGTRLTRITAWMRARDPDHALALAAAGVRDGLAGTRIADSLAEFNRRWARRLLDSRTRVLLVTDGLEQGPPERLAFEMERLRKSCRRLLWGNPLLRYPGFEPRAAGPRAMLPQVHAMLPAHDLHSLRQLVQQLASTSLPRPVRASPQDPDPWK